MGEKHDGPIDLSQFKKEHADGPELPVDVQEEVEPLTTECAFLVYLDEHGHWTADGDVLGKRPVMIGRPATYHDYLAAAATIEKDVYAIEIANRTVTLQMQNAAMMQQRIQSEAIRRQIEMGGGQPGGVPPGMPWPPGVPKG